MVRAELVLLRKAMASPVRYSQFALVSDDTFPLKAPQALADHFDNELNRINLRLLGKEELVYDRYGKFYFFDHLATSLKGRPIESSYIDEELLARFAEISELMKVEKKQIDLYYGSQWWSLHRKAIVRILTKIDEDPFLVKSFEYSAVPDETFFQTLIGSVKSEFEVRHSPMYVDWSAEVRPFIFSNVGEIEMLESSQYAFIRKIKYSEPFMVQLSSYIVAGVA